ncbi:hypothetical protein G5C65_37735 [Streptomyces sp. SB3404]|uniref:Uncharacterized protein n=1 Tax=Streptomyces boncukensis TaxID=2711219 RepID=A0A6G4X9P1_9ACTN|nr:hypothetical protein [Streptomyces boncukensis]
MSGGLLAALAGGGAVAAVLLLNPPESRDGAGGAGPSLAEGAERPSGGLRTSAADSDGSGGPTGSGSSRGSSGRSLPPAPDGYRTVDDPLGFRMAVPKGFTRSLEPPRVFYYSEGKRFRIGVLIQDQEPGGALGVMRKDHREAPDHYPGYRDGKVGARQHRGFPGARWEFTWDGGPGDGGPRHTYDQSWDEAGKMYDVWVSSPLPEVSEGKGHFDTALRTFVRTRPR